MTGETPTAPVEFDPYSRRSLNDHALLRFVMLPARN